MKARRVGPMLLVAVAAATVAATLGSAGQQSIESSTSWEMPRTPDGRPDLQGNWTNATLTPVQRPPGLGPVFTPEQVAELESDRQAFIERSYAASDPDRQAPTVGGEFTGDPLFDAASGGTGGYNYVWIDGGDEVAIFNGEPRTSLVTDPPDGRIPALTPEARSRFVEQRQEASRFGEYDNPENRPLGERCIMSFGSNAGPPMLPNYFYNNNYTIVQTRDHLVIHTEMVHDTRVIRLGEPEPLPAHIRPWMGDSWGRWVGDTLVVETTNLPPRQLNAQQFIYPGGSERMTVVERFTRADESTINYEFTVIDPATYTSEWGGQVPFRKLDGLLYEYACHEGNYALFNVLSGARAQERGGS